VELRDGADEPRIKLQEASLAALATLKWRSVSPSATLMIDPISGARAVIRDTGADAGRFLWSVLAPDQMDPMSDGRTDDIALAQALVDVVLRAHAENRLDIWTGVSGGAGALHDNLESCGQHPRRYECRAARRRNTTERLASY
jgi:hypothetical protein